MFLELQRHFETCRFIYVCCSAVLVRINVLLSSVTHTGHTNDVRAIETYEHICYENDLATNNGHSAYLMPS